MHTNPVVLMVTARAGNFDALCRAIKEGGRQYETRRADDVSAALARLAGGGVHSALVDVSGKADNAAKIECVRRFRAAAPELPVILWSASEDPGIAATAAQAGADGWLTNGSTPQEVIHVLSGVLENLESARVQPASNATIIAVMGVKGGVGATTVAMNIAAALSTRGSVILAEIRPMFGSLQAYFQPGRMIRGFPNQREAGAIERAADVVRWLWPVPGVDGLRVLFGPQTPRDCGDISLASANLVVRALAAQADFLVVDLPASLSAANRAILGESHHLALVLEPVQACLRMGHLTLEGIRGWEQIPASIATVVVKQSSDGVPLPPTSIEAELGIPIHCVVPPAPELCIQGERARLPLVRCNPDSLAAESFVTLASRFPLQSSRLSGRTAQFDKSRATPPEIGPLRAAG